MLFQWLRLRKVAAPQIMQTLVSTYLRPGLHPAHCFCIDLHVVECRRTSHFYNTVSHLLQRRKTSTFWHKILLHTKTFTLKCRTEDPYLKTGYKLRTKKSSLKSLKFSENISPQEKSKTFSCRITLLSQRHFWTQNTPNLKKKEKRIPLRNRSNWNTSANQCI